MVSPIRFSGMASGLDTEQMVKDLMKAQRAPLNKLLQKKQLEEWKRDSYREMNSLLLDLKNTVFDMKLQRTYLQKTASSENEAAVSVKTVGTPSLSTYTVEVLSLAQPAKPATAVYSSSLADANTAVGSGNEFSFDLNGTKIDVTAADTINSVVKKINDVSSTTGVTATYFNNKLILTSKTAGSTAAISITNTTVPGNVLGISDGSFSNGADGTPGQVIINGVTQSISSNTFTYDNMEFTIKQTSAPITVNVKTNEDAIFNAIKGFVDKYNEVIDKINTKITEKQYRDYQPLLDEQKQEMSEKQIELWEEKAKSGLLRQDSILSSALYDMRQSLSNAVKGVTDSNFDMLYEIGISTSKYSDNKYAYMENGKLYIDETKLREAIRNNGDKVMELFTKTSSITNPTTEAEAKQKFDESGLAQRLYDKLDVAIKNLTKKAGMSGILVDNSTIGKEIDQINDDIRNWEDRLAKIEDRYWKQFTAMESALQRLNSQSSWLAQQLGGIGGGQ
ncbi:flagellar hook-associated protein 2 [Brevibacillus sp. LEMMJ03]|uniref:flagellar hook-associated protein 2 n=1 Tax=Brevibacillus sp. LEMMJ03 TaxID=2595056 RepID=UPI00117E5A05|nr:flagellar hook-associated protein 2 [Brevibacillus sp. LEMMJ03]TRY24507.1 flagellar hook-associated protein 2 [Brevibacillus sp. LEMMJ03]